MEKKEIVNSAKLSEILNGKLISFAYHSGKIENEKITYNDTREIFEHDGVVKYTGDLRTLFEIRNSKDATEYYLDAFDRRQDLEPFRLLLIEQIIKTWKKQVD